MIRRSRANTDIPWLRRVALGLVPGWSVINKFGQNTDVDAAGEDVWNGGGTYTGFPAGAAETLSIASSSNEDTITTGTGLWTLTMEGLDADGYFQTETINLTGTTPVVTTSTWTRMNRAYGVTSGSAATSVGAITVNHSSTTANVFAVMPAGSSQTQIAAYTIPRGYTGLLLNGGASTLRTGAGGVSTREATVSFQIRLAAANSPWRRFYPSGASAQHPIDRDFDTGQVIPARTDVKATVLSANATSDVTAYFEILLRQDGY